MEGDRGTGRARRKALGAFLGATLRSFSSFVCGTTGTVVWKDMTMRLRTVLSSLPMRSYVGTYGLQRFCTCADAQRWRQGRRKVMEAHVWRGVGGVAGAGEIRRALTSVVEGADEPVGTAFILADIGEGEPDAW